MVPTTSSSAPDAIRHEVLYGDRIVPCYAERALNLDDMLRRSVAAQADRPVIEDGARTLSYRELDRQASHIANAFAAQGIAAGDRVALFVGNRTEFVVLLFGLWRLGAIVVPIGIRQSAAELHYMLDQCGAQALVFDASLVERLPARAEIPAVQLLVHIDEPGAATAPDLADSISLGMLLELAGDDHVSASFSDQTPACIMYTSGTTGHPKGAVLSHLGFFHTARHYVRHFGYTASDRMLLAIPGSHISGLLAVIVVAVQAGGCIVMLREFHAKEVLAEIEARRITATVMVPAMYNLCLLQPEMRTRELTCWRIGHFGGAAMPEITIQHLAEVLPGMALYNGFGATETTSAMTLTAPGDAARHPDTVGSVVPCVDIRVVDAQGIEVPVGAPGELWIKSPGNAIAYWNNVEASHAAFVSGYWRSGDVGSIDADGRVRVLDRIKDMINRGGYKVYCVELENVIQRYPGVIEVAAVSSPDPVLGERVHVFVYASQPIDSEALRAFCRDALADYKTPDFVTLCPSPLPRNLNGKLVKASLREQARQDAERRAAAAA